MLLKMWAILRYSLNKYDKVYLDKLELKIYLVYNAVVLTWFYTANTALKIISAIQDHFWFNFCNYSYKTVKDVVTIK